MIASSMPSSEQRRTPRMILPVRYTLVRVGTSANQRYAWTGHIFDIGASGMRLGLEMALRIGTHVYVRALLPGTNTLTVNAQGTIIHVANRRDEKLGLFQMGMAFEHFDYLADRRALISHLLACGLEIASPSMPLQHANSA